MYKNIFIASLSVHLSLLTACASYNPFDTGVKARSKAPENATEYVCDGKQHFYVRMLNNGNDAWLILPEYEVNLSKGSGTNRYTAGAIALEINGDQSTLNDGDKIAYTACKAQVTAK